MYIIRLVLVLLVIPSFISLQVFSQSTPFIPSNDELSTLQTLIEKSERIYEKEISGLPVQNRKEMMELYSLRHENIKAKFEKREINTAPAATSYLQKILQEIVTANPMLAKENPGCYFSKSGIPNASYLGESVIIFNMGLFEKLDNESQAAFILCHELAHAYLHHSENSIRKYVTTVNSEEVQLELKSIKKKQFNKRTDLEKLQKSLTFNSRHHSRDHESEADSLAVEFLRNTRFDVSESLSTLALLDSIDTDTLKIEDCLQRTFDAPGYPFKRKWLARESGLLGGHASIEEDPSLSDSLKTHPDCKTRMQLIEPIVMKYQSPQRQKFLVDKDRFNELKSLFRYEIIEYAFISGNYTKSLFYTLSLLDKKPADLYLVAQTGRIFNSMYAAQKKHTLGKLIDLPSPGYPSNYNILLQFIQNLYLEDFAAISYYFLHKYQPVLHSYQPYTTEYNTSIQIAN